MASSTEAVSTPAIADHPVRAALLLGALGVVFGDIGTSPIYAFREALRAAGGPSEAAVFGVLSLVFWAIVLVVAIKYVVFVMRADNEGEGGTMALLSLALPVAGRLRAGLLIVGLAGASLFFGDAIITPAISVLSAVEGLRIVSPMVTPYVVPIAAVVLVCLFSIQSRGSGAVGFLFGPIMAVWFVTLAVVGLIHLVQYPRVLLALSPTYALAYAGHVGPWNHVCGLRLGVSRFDRRGGALRGHGSLREIRDPHQLVRVRRARSCSGLSRARRPCAGRSDGGGKSLFPPVSDLAVGACNSSDDGCDRDRKPGRAVRRLRSRSASHSTRRYSAARSASDFPGVGWPGLCAASQLAAGGRSFLRSSLDFALQTPLPTPMELRSPAT